MWPSAPGPSVALPARDAGKEPHTGGPEPQVCPTGRQTDRGRDPAPCPTLGNSCTLEPAARPRRAAPGLRNSASATLWDEGWVQLQREE